MNLSPKLIRRSFRTGIVLKGIDGLLESMAGVLLAMDPSLVRRIGLKLWVSQLLHDPTPLAPHLAHASQRLANTSPHFAAAYLLAHGAAKIVLVIALWMDKLWAYPAAIVAFAAFVIWEAFRFTHTHSIALILLMILDVAIVCLIWMEYGAQKQKRQDRGH